MWCECLLKNHRHCHVCRSRAAAAVFSNCPSAERVAFIFILKRLVVDSVVSLSSRERASVVSWSRVTQRRASHSFSHLALGTICTLYVQFVVNARVLVYCVLSYISPACISGASFCVFFVAIVLYIIRLRIWRLCSDCAQYKRFIMPPGSHSVTRCEWVVCVR